MGVSVKPICTVQYILNVQYTFDPQFLVISIEQIICVKTFEFCMFLVKIKSFPVIFSPFKFYVLIFNNKNNYYANLSDLPSVFLELLLLCFLGSKKLWPAVNLYWLNVSSTYVDTIIYNTLSDLECMSRQLDCSTVFNNP